MLNIESKVIFVVPFAYSGYYDFSNVFTLVNTYAVLIRYQIKYSLLNFFIICKYLYAYN